MREVYLDVTILLARLVLAAQFAMAGVMKIQGGVKEFVTGGFQQAKPAWLPDWFATPYGYALPFVELLVGVMLLIGLYTRVTAAVMAMMLISFMIVLGVMHKEMLFHPNVVWLAMALLFTTLGPGRISVDQLIGRRKPVRA